MNTSLTSLDLSAPVETKTDAPSLPTLDAVLAEMSPALPPDALFLGVAEDGLPMLLDLYDPVPGAILLAGDEDSGKANLLRVMIRAVLQTHPPEQVRYAVLTQRPAAWDKIPVTPHQTGVYPIEQDSAEALLGALVEWAHHNKGGEECLLLLVEDLNALIRLSESVAQHLRWLLLRGASRRVWVFAALDSLHAANLADWLHLFRARLFGHIDSSEDAETLTGEMTGAFDELGKGYEFAMPDGEGWIKFWLPI